MASLDLLALPYQVARTPLAILETTLLQRLDESSPVRRGFCRGFGVLDLAAGRLFNDESLARQGAERLWPATPAEREPEPEPTPVAKATPKPRPRAQAQRTATAKRMQHDSARSNKNLATIAQDLARTEAVIEARDDHADEDAD